MKQLITAVLGDVHRVDGDGRDDKVVATIDCELRKDGVMLRQGIVEIEERPNEGSPVAVPGAELTPFISLVDLTHTAVSHYLQAMRQNIPRVIMPRTRVTMEVDLA